MDASEVQDPQPDVETRLSALESAVERLNSIVQAGFGGSNIAAPVAIPFLKEAAQHEFSARFFALMDLGEALLKYSTAIAFAAAIQSPGALADELTELFRQPPTLGKMAEGLRKVLDSDTGTHWPVDLVRVALRRPNGKPTSTARYLLEEFITIRNDERGHGAQQPEGYYQSLYLKNHLIIHDCLRACKYVQLPLVHVHAIDHVKDQYGYKTTLLMGGSAIQAAEPIVTSVKASVGATCLWDHGVQILALDQFVSYRYCDTCRLEHVFFADRITSEKISYHSYFGNHRTTVDRITK